MIDHDRPLRSDPSPRRSARGRRNGFVLVVVLVAMIVALLLATRIAHVGQVHAIEARTAAREADRRQQARAALDVLMAAIDRQRETILVGDVPELRDRYELHTAGGRRVVAVLLPVGPGGERLVAEAAKLDLNHVDAETLGGLDDVGPELADAIIAHRDGLPAGRFGRVEQLLEVEGVTPELLWGPMDDLDFSGALSEEGPDRAELIDLRLDRGTERGLADHVTVYAVEPPLQRDGRLRINLNTEWSSELGDRLDERFGEGTGATVRQIMQSTTFEDDRVIYETLDRFDLDPTEWPDIVDALTTCTGELQFGCVDLNRADEAVLACLPGLDAELARTIVDARDTIAIEDRATAAWPAAQGLVPTEAYRELGGRVTSRSWTWRVRVAVGELVETEDGSEPVGGPLVLEAVIDLADPAPRLAYLRDVSMLPLSVGLASMMVSETEDRSDRAASPSEGGAPEERFDDAVPSGGFGSGDFGSGDFGGGPDALDPAENGFMDDSEGSGTGFDDAPGGEERPGTGRDPAEAGDQRPYDGSPGRGDGGSSGSRVGRWTAG